MQELQKNDGQVAVLVSYKFLRYRFSKWRIEAVMVHVNHSREIIPAFNYKMSSFKNMHYEIVSYLPQNLERVF